MMTKFRAVYKHDIVDGKLEKGLMFYSREIDSKLYFVMECDEECRYPFEIPFLDDDWIVMRHIENADFYEGDIIEYENGNCGYGRPREEELNLKVIPQLTDHDEYECFNWWKCGKVVGNIYENPELIELDIKLCK